MNTLTRRRFLQSTLSAGAAVLAPSVSAIESKGDNLFIAPFRFDVTPPKGHSLCGGWIKPALEFDDPLEAIGFCLLGAGKPIVVCAIDWTGLLNGAHVAWRTAIAEAAGTTPERVALQCVHQHNAPMACIDTDKLISDQGNLPHVIEIDFFRRCVDRAREAVQAAIKQARPVTGIARGEARVDQVASNRRVAIGADGKILKMRGSSCKDQSLIDLPEGLIDPMLKTIAFYDRATKVVSCHYYATHPMSYYGDGRVTADFAGLARKQRQTDDPACTHIYFSGCAGNIAAGKYNNGSKEARVKLTRRMHEAICLSEGSLRLQPIEKVSWRVQEILPVPNPLFPPDELRRQIANPKRALPTRIRPAYTLAWIERLERKIPLVLSALQVDDLSMLHLPAEPFVEYQLRAQQIQPKRFVATAGYGDSGPWYLPTREAYPQGGYEVSVAFCTEAVDGVLSDAIRALLT